MKLLIIISLLFISICLSQPIVIDPFNYDFSLSNMAPDSTIQMSYQDSNILGGEKDVFIYQTPMRFGSDATLNASLSIRSSVLDAVDKYGKLSFNIDAEIFGYSIQVYDGIDNMAGHPCGNFMIHLNDPSCDVPRSNVASPGLQLDLSEKEGIAFEILNLDHGNGSNLILRIWDNENNSGFLECTYPRDVATISDERPILYIPFTRFSNNQILKWDNIRAFAIEINTTVAAVDLIIGPLQFLSSQIKKEMISNQIVFPSNFSDFQIQIIPDIFFSFNSDKNPEKLNYFYNLTDFLEFDFLSFDFSSFKIFDEKNEILDNSSYSLQINPNNFTLQISIQNSQKVFLNYSTFAISNFNFCSQNFCNKISTFSKTVLGSSSTFFSLKENESEKCFTLSSFPFLSNSLTNFPTTFQNLLKFETEVCNEGNGLATNVQFFHSSFDSLSSCLPIFENEVNCSENVCVLNLGNIQPKKCLNFSFSFDCSTFEKECLTKQFSSSSFLKEDCLNSSSSPSSFSLSSFPSISIKISESLLSNVSAKINETITWNINASNIGPTNLKSFYLEMNYPQFTFPTPQTLSVWNCGANNLCVFNSSSSLSNGTSFSLLPFSVQVLGSIPVQTTQVCNTLKMNSQPNQPNCVAQDTTTSCASVNPGTPDISLEKVSFASQYTFTIDYSNEGSGNINNLFLQEILQVGWTFNSAASTNGWKCGDTLCVFNISSLSPGTSGSILFVVNVDENSQTTKNGTKKCWNNIVSSIYDDEKYDRNPVDNQASTVIGSSCKDCCDPAPCPTNICSLNCPSPIITTTCPVVECKCEFPEFWCPPCESDPPPCNCNQCGT